MPIVGSFAGASSRAYGLQAGVQIGDFESIATSTLGSSNFIEFTSIPQTYTHLQIRGIARGATTGQGFHQAYIQINGDTASNYSNHVLYSDGTTPSSLGYLSNYISVIALTGPNNTASSFSAMVLDILDYTNTNKYKTTRSLSGGDDNSAGYVWFTSGNWRNTNAITSIKIYANQGSGYFTQYSSFALYGIKG